MRILIADNNIMFTRLVRLKLEKWGHTVDTALTGLEAWDMARRINYRVVILDWPLEGIDGGQLCQQIRNLDRSRYTYILFYSSSSDNESVMKAFEAGTDDYLFKPFNPLLLRLRLKTGKRLLNLHSSGSCVERQGCSRGFLALGLVCACLESQGKAQGKRPR